MIRESGTERFVASLDKPKVVAKKRSSWCASRTRRTERKLRLDRRDWRSTCRVARKEAARRAGGD
jgi:hypothetical protein